MNDLFQVADVWERTFDAIPDMIAIVDTDFRLVRVNKAMANRLGKTPRECAGLICYAAIHGTLTPPPYCPHAKTLRDLREHAADVCEERLGGKLIVSVSPICDSAGAMIGSVHVIRDLTERLKADEERKRLEEQLHQAQKMEEIGELAGGIAHDFNNILTAIIGYAEIISVRLERNSPLRRSIEQVLTAAKRAAELTNGLLAFSRRQVMHTKPTTYGLIQQHNDCVPVSSETGKGTTFKAYLPLIADNFGEVSETQEMEALPGGRETVLVVEDEATVRELHRMILEGAGYRIIEAVDGQDALAKFLEHREVDIVVTDVIMPKMDGKRLYEEIARIRPDMKVLFLSGYTKDIIVKRGILEEDASLMSKPVTTSTLLNKVREILDR